MKPYSRWEPHRFVAKDDHFDRNRKNALHSNHPVLLPLWFAYLQRFDQNQNLTRKIRIWERPCI